MKKAGCRCIICMEHKVHNIMGNDSVQPSEENKIVKLPSDKQVLTTNILMQLLYSGSLLLLGIIVGVGIVLNNPPKDLCVENNDKLIEKYEILMSENEELQRILDSVKNGVQKDLPKSGDVSVKKSVGVK